MTQQTPKYYPPDHQVLDHFARSVGNDLGGDYAEPEIVRGLADFMQVISEVLANNLNRKHKDEFDNRIE